MKSRTKQPTTRAKPAAQRVIFTPLPAPDAGAGVPDDTAPGAHPELRRAMIAEAAYYRAEQRGFEPGRELEDWCAAESDIDSLLAHESSSSVCGG